MSVYLNRTSAKVPAIGDASASASSMPLTSTAPQVLAPTTQTEDEFKIPDSFNSATSQGQRKQGISCDQSPVRSENVVRDQETQELSSEPTAANLSIELKKLVAANEELTRAVRDLQDGSAALEARVSRLQC